MEENNVNGTVTTNVSRNYEGNTSRSTNVGSNTKGNSYTTEDNIKGNSYTTDSNTTNTSSNIYTTGNKSIKNNYATGNTTVSNAYTVGANYTTSNNYASGVPAKVSVWSKIKQILCQEITVDLTPRQERAFKEVYDFWHQDITVAGTKEFWLQDIEITL